MKKVLLFVILITNYFSLTPVINVPKNWDIVKFKEENEYIFAGIVKKSKNNFKPSINIAREISCLSLDEYVKLAKNDHENEINTSYDILDTLEIDNTKATISQINKNFGSFNIKMLQLILKKDDNIFVITSASKSEDFLKNYKTFFEVFYSFKTVDDIHVLHNNESLKQKFNELIQATDKNSNTQLLKNIRNFEKYIDKNFKNLGKYFKFLIIKQAIEEINGQNI